MDGNVEREMQSLYLIGKKNVNERTKKNVD